MELITFESSAFKTLEIKLDFIIKYIQKSESNRDKDRWLTPKEVAAYVGFTTAWVKERSAIIGASQDSRGLRYKKSDVEKFMQSRYFKK